MGWLVGCHAEWVRPSDTGPQATDMPRCARCAFARDCASSARGLEGVTEHACRRDDRRATRDSGMRRALEGHATLVSTATVWERCRAAALIPRPLPRGALGTHHISEQPRFVAHSRERRVAASIPSLPPPGAGEGRLPTVDAGFSLLACAVGRR
jgi:hypothetical protein